MSDYCWTLSIQYCFYPMSNSSKAGSEVFRKMHHWKNGLNFSVQRISNPPPKKKPTKQYQTNKQKNPHNGIIFSGDLFLPEMHFYRNSSSVLLYWIKNSEMCRWSWLLGQESVSSLLSCLKKPICTFLSPSWAAVVLCGGA